MFYFCKIYGVIILIALSNYAYTASFPRSKSLQALEEQCMCMVCKNDPTNTMHPYTDTEQVLAAALLLTPFNKLNSTTLTSLLKVILEYVEDILWVKFNEGEGGKLAVSWENTHNPHLVVPFITKTFPGGHYPPQISPLIEQYVVFQKNDVQNFQQYIQAIGSSFNNPPHMIRSSDGKYKITATQVNKIALYITCEMKLDMGKRIVSLMQQLAEQKYKKPSKHSSETTSCLIS